MKNIIIYSHTHNFTFKDGGTVVKFQLAKILEELGQNVMIYSNNKIPNSIFSKYYNNDFPIDSNCVVIYSDSTVGNPLNAPLIVRWILSKLGQNVPLAHLNSWDKNELVYYFNSEEKLANNPDKLGIIYKLLNVIYLNPYVVNNNFPNRRGTCYTFRKAFNILNKMPQFVHPPGSTEITSQHNQIDCVKIFNNHKYFISYDSISFLSVIAALCGCITIVKKVDGLSKQDWINTCLFSEYLKYSGEDMLYGIAYGAEELEKASNTIHLAKEQWNRIYNYSKENYVKSFIEDINNWDNKINTIESNFYIDSKQKNINIYGVYFICCINNYLEVVEEQLSILDKGLLNVTTKLILFITKYNKNDNNLNNLLSKFNKYNNFILVLSSENLYEKFAINNYNKYIKDSDYYMYYFHTKALKSPNDPLAHILASRRKLLNIYTLEKYIINIKLLQYYDAVGCSLNLYPKKHFSGNFWWSKSSYLNTLSNINNNYLSPEMYILSNNNCNVISLADDTNDILFENYSFRDDLTILRNINSNFKNNIEHQHLISMC
jgi:hypothetical protein